MPTHTHENSIASIEQKFSSFLIFTMVFLQAFFSDFDTTFLSISAYFLYLIDIWDLAIYVPCC